MNRIFFTSDPHYFHKNIAGAKVSSWKDGYRNFNDEKEMSRHIVKVWNQAVSEDDILYCLGDWSFGGIKNIWNFRKQLRCKNIHLVLGNHDEHIRKNIVLPNVHQVYNDFHNIDKIFIDEKPNPEQSKLYVEAQELFSSVQDVLTVKHGSHTFFLSHYSHRIWKGSHKGVIHLYGHSHDSLDNSGNYYGKSMDCGIDSAKRILGEYKPFSIEEIISIMEKRDIKTIDKHEK